jgi:hypothetical protein
MDAARLAQIGQQVDELERELSMFLANAAAAADESQQKHLIHEAILLHAKATLLRNEMEDKQRIC